MTESVMAAIAALGITFTSRELEAEYMRLTGETVEQARQAIDKVRLFNRAQDGWWMTLRRQYNFEGIVKWALPQLKRDGVKVLMSVERRVAVDREPGKKPVWRGNEDVFVMAPAELAVAVGMARSSDSQAEAGIRYYKGPCAELRYPALPKAIDAVRNWAVGQAA